MVKEKTKKVIKISWTPIQLQIAIKAQGGASQEDLVKEGFTASLVSKVFTAIKDGQKAPEEPPEDPPKDDKIDSKLEKPSPAIEVGKITIKPENWALSQYGAIVVLDTYEKAKRDLGYTGTIGDFLCDMCEFYRRLCNYREVEYGRQVETESSGGDGAEENGGAGSESREAVSA